jgi:hypothetical protein
MNNNKKIQSYESKRETTREVEEEGKREKEDGGIFKK